MGNPLVAWDRDGRHLAFGGDRFGPTNLFLQVADGSGEPERLLASDRIQMPMSFAPDGRLIFSADAPGHARDVEAMAAGEEPDRRYPTSPSHDHFGMSRPGGTSFFDCG